MKSRFSFWLRLKFWLRGIRVVNVKAIHSDPKDFLGIPKIKGGDER
jgi:hypothetical protein